MTTDERIAELVRYGFWLDGERSNDVDWLCTELRRAREALRKIASYCNTPGGPCEAKCPEHNIARHGLGDP